MTDHESLERRMREANPVPALDALHKDELLAVRSLLEQRRGMMTSPQQAPRQAARWRKPVLAAAAAFLVTIAAGTAAYFAFGRTEKPTTATTGTSLPATTVAEVATSLEDVTTTAPAAVVIPEGAVFTGTRIEDTTGALTGEDSEFVSQVIAGGPGLVAVGAADDGCDWGPWGELGVPKGFALVEGWSYLCGGAVWLSADGEAWTRVPDPEGVFSAESGVALLTGVADNGSRLVAVGITGTQGDLGSPFGPKPGVWVSDNDGASWRRVPHDEAAFGGEGRHLVWSVIPTDFGFVAAGDELWSSPDGWTWTRVGPMHQVRRMARTPDGYVAVGYDNPIAAAWTSPDGLSWTPLAVPAETPISGDTAYSAMFDVVAGPAGVVAVGSEGLFSDMNWDAGVWLADEDGEWSWVQGDVFARGLQQEIQGVTVVGDRLVAVGSQNSTFNVFGPAQSWISDDGGRTWSRVESEALGQRGDWVAMTTVVTLGSKVVAMGYEGPWHTGSDLVVWIGTWE
ncbi:MAG TPA: hypothetical protein VLS92_10465 [Acidimicrobiia bacterium]|nr:hypothetical protein [Acidimicrobiia bacterium]